MNEKNMRDKNSRFGSIKGSFTSFVMIFAEKLIIASSAENVFPVELSVAI